MCIAGMYSVYPELYMCRHLSCVMYKAGIYLVLYPVYICVVYSWSWISVNCVCIAGIVCAGISREF